MTYIRDGYLIQRIICPMILWNKPSAQEDNLPAQGNKIAAHWNESAAQGAERLVK
jgi:hypothetical protein